jgi:hypothetical protein
VSILRAINRVAQHKPQDFTAPVPSRNGSVFVVQEGIPYRFNLSVAVPGWYMIHPVGLRRAEVGALAEEWQRIMFLEALPRFLCIVVAMMGDIVIVVPYNISDANQRGWKDGEPSPVYLVSEHLQAFDIILARRMGGILYYDRIDSNLVDKEVTDARACIMMESVNALEINLNANWQNAYAFVHQRVMDERKEALRKLQYEQNARSKDDLNWHLNFMGAILLEEQHIGDRIVVTYSYGEHEHKLTVDKSMKLVSAGICIAGTEREHNLSSAVAVIERAYELNRFDLPGRRNADLDDDDYDADDY